MKKLVSTIALLSITANLAVAGGKIQPVYEPIEVAKPEVVLDNEIKYDGFYLGASVSHVSMNEAVTTSGYGLSLIAGYYFNKYFGIESRYSRTVTDLDVDYGAEIISEAYVLENIGLYLKPMFNLTTGFSFYGLAGYGHSTYETLDDTYSKSGLQWGLGAKYELAEGIGIFIDYMDIYNDDDYDGIILEDISYGAVNIGTTYTF